jgi:hypothetical protein
MVGLAWEEREREMEQLAYVCVHEYLFWIVAPARPSAVLFMPSAMIMSCGEIFRPFRHFYHAVTEAKRRYYY